MPPQCSDPDTSDKFKDGCVVVVEMMMMEEVVVMMMIVAVVMVVVVNGFPSESCCRTFGPNVPL